jgi:hypothetical protein
VGPARVPTSLMAAYRFARTARVRCPACGEMGTLVVGLLGRYPWVEHRSEPEINPREHTECWLATDHPLVAALRAEPLPDGRPLPKRAPRGGAGFRRGAA